MIPALPYDVWSIIYINLTKAQRYSLYPVNSALFHLVMGERYSDLNALNPDDDHTSQCLFNLSPIVANRVRSLAFRPRLFRDCLKGVERGSPSIWRGLFRGILQDKQKSRMASMKGQLMLDNIPKMTALSDLKIDCYLSEDVDLLLRSMRIIKSGWIGPSWLSKLELKAPLDMFQGLVSSAPVFQNLKDLALTLTRGYLHIAKQEAEIRSFSTKAADFVNNKCYNASSLSVVFPYFPMSVDPFFGTISPMSHLSSLSVVLPTYSLEGEDLMEFHAFLSKHADNLRTLSIGFDHQYEGYSAGAVSILAHPIFLVPFPCLSTLTLQAVYSRTARRAFPEFLTSYLVSLKATLTHLHIRHHLFNFDQLRVVLVPLTAGGSLLQVLKVELKFLKCELFQFLSTNFTQLKELDITFSYPREDDSFNVPPFGPLIGEHDGGANDTLLESVTRQFSEGIQMRNCAGWSLRKLQMNYRAYDPVHFSYDASRHFAQFKRSIANALPSVVTFNGQDRETFIGSSE